ncbi:MAG: hypothetical protein RSE23_01830 [Clostridia bacterium]
MAKGGGPKLRSRIGIDGEKEYREALGNVSSRLKTLKSEMSITTAEFKAQGTTMSGLHTRYVELAEQYDLQREKVGTLAEMLDKAKEKFGENSDEAKNLENALNNAMAEVVTTEGALDKCAAEMDEMKVGVGDVAKAVGGAFLSGLKNSAVALGGAFLSALRGAAAGVQQLAKWAGTAASKGYALAKSAGAMADNVLTTSDQTGVAADQLQKWTFAANFMDTSVETITGSMARMTHQIGAAEGGSKTAQKAFGKLGVGLRDNVTGELRSSEAIFADAIDALGKMSDETERDALAMDLFGRSAQDLNPLIKAGGDAVNAMGQEAEKLGMVFGSEQLKTMGGFDDSIQRMNAVSKGLTDTIGLLLIPAFQPLVDTASSSMGQLSQALKDGLQPGEIATIAQTFLGSLTESLGTISAEITNAMPAIQTAAGELVNALVTALPGLAGTVIPAAFTLLQTVLNTIATNSEPIAAMATQLITFLATSLSQNVTGLASSCLAIVTGIVDGITANLPALVTSAATVLIQFATALVGAIPELAARLPEICTAIWDGLVAVDWISLGTNLIQGLVNGLISAVSSLLDAIKGVFEKIWKAILGVFGIASPSTEAQNAAGFILQGLLDGFESAVSAVCDTVKRIFGKIWEAIKSIFGFGSESEESKEAKNAGKDIMTGMQSGIEDNEGTLETAVRTVAQKVLWAMMAEMGIANATSTTTKGYGLAVVQGIEDGLKATETTKFNAGASKVMTAINAAFDSVLEVKYGQGSMKFYPIGEKIAQGIAWGLKDSSGSTDNATTIKGAIVAVANAAYTAAVTEMSTGITGGTETVNAAVDAVATAALAAAAALLNANAGSAMGTDWMDALATAIEDAEKDIAQESRTTAKAGVDAAKVLMNAQSGRTIGAAFGEGLGGGISGTQGAVSSAARGLGNSAMSALWAAVGGSGGTRFEAVGEAVAHGMARGIEQNTSFITHAAHRAAQAAYDAAAKALDMRSPSRKMMAAGEMYDRGFAMGIERNVARVTEAAGTVARAAAGRTTGSRTESISIDYERLGTEVAAANRRAGIGAATIRVGKRELGKTIEQDVSRETRRRSTQSVRGRNSRMVLA